MGLETLAMGENATMWYGYDPSPAASITFLSIAVVQTAVNIVMNFEHAVHAVNRMPLIQCSIGE